MAMVDNSLPKVRKTGKLSESVLPRNLIVQNSNGDNIKVKSISIKITEKTQRNFNYLCLIQLLRSLVIFYEFLIPDKEQKVFLKNCRYLFVCL